MLPAISAERVSQWFRSVFKEKITVQVNENDGNILCENICIRRNSQQPALLGFVQC
jgi:hypothetical protein